MEVGDHPHSLPALSHVEVAPSTQKVKDWVDHSQYGHFAEEKNRWPHQE